MLKNIYNTLRLVNALFVNLISKSKNAWNWILHSEINLKVVWNFQGAFQCAHVCCSFNIFIVMSNSFHSNFDCCCNVINFVTAFRNLNFNPLSLSGWVVLITSPNLNETRRMSKNVVFIRKIRKTIIRLQIHQNHLILSRVVQLDWWVKSCLCFCRILWNHNLTS